MPFGEVELSRTAVTGGAGFIGSYLVHALLERGHSVVVIDNLSTGSLDNLRPIIDDVLLIKADVRDRATVSSALEGVDVVYHLAAVGSVPMSVADPYYVHDVNANGTLSVLLASQDSGVSRVVFASSSAVYGDGVDGAVSEGIAPHPSSPYAASKLAGEAYMKAFHDSYGIETQSLRYFNVYGPRQPFWGDTVAVVPNMVSHAVRGEEIVIEGDGNQTRDFVFVNDVAQANLLALEAPMLTGGALNVGTGTGISINGLVSMLESVMGQPLTVRRVAARRGDVRTSTADVSRADTLLSYRSSVPLRTGLAITIDWVRALHVCR